MKATGAETRSPNRQGPNVGAEQVPQRPALGRFDDDWRGLPLIAGVGVAGPDVAPPGVLLSLPHRLALLREGACTFLQVLGANDLLDRVQAVVKLERLVFRHHLRVSQ
jgi:hypothetical protein